MARKLALININSKTIAWQVCQTKFIEEYGIKNNTHEQLQEFSTRNENDTSNSNI